MKLRLTALFAGLILTGAAGAGSLALWSQSATTDTSMRLGYSYTTVGLHGESSYRLGDGRSIRLPVPDRVVSSANENGRAVLLIKFSDHLRATSTYQRTIQATAQAPRGAHVPAAMRWMTKPEECQVTSGPLATQLDGIRSSHDHVGHTSAADSYLCIEIGQLPLEAEGTVTAKATNSVGDPVQGSAGWKLAEAFPVPDLSDAFIEVLFETERVAR